MVIAPELRSERLRLRDITETDTCLIVQWRSNPDVYKYFIAPHRLTEEEHLHWFKSRYIEDRNRFDWIALDDENQAVGIFGVKRENDLAEEAEVSYILDPNYYGRGYAAEAVKRLIVFCKTEWCCKTVIAEIHKDNEKSIRFAKKLGFVEYSRNGSFIFYRILT